MPEGMSSLGGVNRPAINMNNSEVGHNPNDKNGSEAGYYYREEEEEQNSEFRESEFVDRSAQLRATLNSLASLNAASIINMKNKKK